MPHYVPESTLRSVLLWLPPDLYAACERDAATRGQSLASYLEQIVTSMARQSLLDPQLPLMPTRADGAR